MERVVDWAWITNYVLEKEGMSGIFSPPGSFGRLGSSCSNPQLLHRENVGKRAGGASAEAKRALQGIFAFLLSQLRRNDDALEEWRQARRAAQVGRDLGGLPVRQISFRRFREGNA